MMDVMIFPNNERPGMNHIKTTANTGSSIEFLEETGMINKEMMIIEIRNRGKKERIFIDFKSVSISSFSIPFKTGKLCIACGNYA
jgi:hypothetical protein